MEEFYRISNGLNPIVPEKVNNQVDKIEFIKSTYDTLKNDDIIIIMDENKNITNTGRVNITDDSISVVSGDNVVNINDQINFGNVYKLIL